MFHRDRLSMCRVAGGGRVRGRRRINELDRRKEGSGEGGIGLVERGRQGPRVNGTSIQMRGAKRQSCEAD